MNHESNSPKANAAESPLPFDLEPIDGRDFEFKHNVYSRTIKPYIDALYGWDETQHVANLRSLLESSRTHSAIVIQGKRIGVVQIEETRTEISLRQIAILPEYQRRGNWNGHHPIIDDTISRSPKASALVSVSGKYQSPSPVRAVGIPCGFRDGRRCPVSVHSAGNAILRVIRTPDEQSGCGPVRRSLLVVPPKQAHVPPRIVGVIHAFEYGKWIGNVRDDPATVSGKRSC